MATAQITQIRRQIPRQIRPLGAAPQVEQVQQQSTRETTPRHTPVRFAPARSVRSASRWVDLLGTLGATLLIAAPYLLRASPPEFGVFGWASVALLFTAAAAKLVQILFPPQNARVRPLLRRREV